MFIFNKTKKLRHDLEHLENRCNHLETELNNLYSIVRVILRAHQCVYYGSEPSSLKVYHSLDKKEGEINDLAKIYTVSGHN